MQTDWQSSVVILKSFCGGRSENVIAIARITKDRPLKINFDGDRKFIFRMPDFSKIKDEKHGETNEEKMQIIFSSMTEIPSLQIRNVKRMVKYAMGRLKA